MTLKFGNPVFVVAEAGINHNGDIEIAKEMIKKAAESGANAIKFQTIIPDELFSPVTNPQLYELSKSWVLTKSDHKELQKFATKNNIVFFSTPFGKKSAKLLQEINVPIMKIASGEITNHDLISFVAQMKKPMIVSTGMSSITEVAAAIAIIKNHNCPFVLLHCISTYPTMIDDTNLATIPFLHNTFGVPIGFSDHTEGFEACLAAVALGACVIEKHFTLDKTMEGPDQQLSMDPSEFAELVKKIRLIEKSIGSPRVMPIEAENTFKTNMQKSIATARDIPAGSIITRSMLTYIRPAKGIPPSLVNEIVGRKTKKHMKKGSLIKWDDF